MGVGAEAGGVVRSRGRMLGLGLGGRIILWLDGISSF